MLREHVQCGTRPDKLAGAPHSVILRVVDGRVILISVSCLDLNRGCHNCEEELIIFT